MLRRTATNDWRENMDEMVERYCSEAAQLAYREEKPVDIGPLEGELEKAARKPKIRF
jgi:hypothetical protein